MSYTRSSFIKRQFEYLLEERFPRQLEGNEIIFTRGFQTNIPYIK